MFSENIPANNRGDSVISPSARSTLWGHGLFYKNFVVTSLLYNYIGKPLRYQESPRGQEEEHYGEIINHNVN